MARKNRCSNKATPVNRKSQKDSHKRTKANKKVFKIAIKAIELLWTIISIVQAICEFFRK